MNAKQYYTTGEASLLLKISRATVSRKFDSGVLDGKRNPITGERLISHESVISFMKKYHLIPPQAITGRPDIQFPSAAEKAAIQIVVGSPNKKVFETLFKSLNRMSRIETMLFDNGYDAIIHCSNNLPDILILDENLKHISFKDVIHSLRHLDARQKLNILLILNTSDPVKMDDIDADAYLFWDMLGFQSADQRHESIGYAVGRLLGNKDIIQYYEEKNRTNAYLSHYQSIIEWVEHMYPLLFEEVSSTCAHFMEKLPDDDTVKGAADTLQEYTVLLRYMLSPLRMTANTHTPVMTVLSLDSIVERCVSLVRRISKAKYHVKARNDIWSVAADEDLIAGVIFQVLMNADQAIDGKGLIEIILKNVSRGKVKQLPSGSMDYVQISVHDSGKGISKKHRGNIFDPFFTTKPGSAGKGLTTVQAIVESHKGLIDVASVPGKGTTVNLYLPVSTDIDTTGKKNR